MLNSNSNISKKGDMLSSTSTNRLGPPTQNFGGVNLQSSSLLRHQAHSASKSTINSAMTTSQLGDLPPNRLAVGMGASRTAYNQSSTSTMDNYAPSRIFGTNNQANMLPARYENSYQLEPGQGQRFSSSRVEKVVRAVLENHLANMKYEASKCRDMTMMLSDEVRTRLKSIVFKRYKLIVSVCMGQNDARSRTSLVVASRALWDATVDNFVTVDFKNDSLYAICTVFAVYHE